MANRILLGQLISNGDCLYATAVAKQIKHDFPGCHLTWAVSSLCRRIIENNPFIDEIWEIPLPNWDDANLQQSWRAFESEAMRRYEGGLYDFAFFTQIYPGNAYHFEGSVRPGIFFGYPGRITVPIRPVLVLREVEVQEVYEFAIRHALASYERVILFECSSKSGQSKMTPELAYRISTGIVSSRLEKCAVILCSQYPVSGETPGIIDGSSLSLRQMAELTKYCTLLFGCSSGISCVATSTWAKPIPMIQLLDESCGIFGSLVHDYEHFGLDADHVIEMFGYTLESVWDCYRLIVTDGWQKTRAMFHQNVPIRFAHYLNILQHHVENVGDFYGVCISLRHTIERYGCPKEIQEFLNGFAQKHIGPEAMHAHANDILDQLRIHFQRAWDLSEDGHTRDLKQFARLPHGSVRPVTCEVRLKRSEEDYLHLLSILSPGDASARRLVGNHYPRSCWLLSAQQPEKVLLLHELETMAKRIPQKDSARGFEQTLAMDPTNPIATGAFALSLMEGSSFGEAYRAFQTLKEIIQDGWSFEFEWILGDLAWMNGEHGHALESYRWCLEQKPADRRLPRLIARLGAREH